MTSESSTPSSTSSANAAARAGWCALILVTLAVCYFSNLGAIGFVGPDEPRYAWIARDMAETGDWVTPRLYGKPWFEKPVLYYWMAGASFRLFGVSEAAARLPSAVCALLATLALAWLSWRVHGAETARWLLLLLPTSVGMIGFSHAAATDMPFSATLTIAMVSAAAVLGFTRNEHSPILPRTPWIALLLFGFFLGLAVLAKGPAAIILCGGAVFFWALFTRKWRDAFRLLHPAAIASFCATALPWYILCAQRNPDFFRVFIIEHNFKRYLTPEFQHIQPFWYYIPVVLISFLPWSAALLWAAIHGCQKFWAHRTISPFTGFLLCWATFCLIFFSISLSKLPGYVLPSFPAICLLLGRAVSAACKQRAFGVVLGGFGLLLLAGLLPLQMGLHPISQARPHIFLSCAAILLTFAGANLALALSQFLNRAEATSLVLRAVAFVIVLFPVFFSNRLIPEFFLSDPSARSLAKVLERHAIPSKQIAFLSGNRAFKYQLSFYLRTEVPDWSGKTTEETYLLSYSDGCKRIELVRATCMAIPLDPDAIGWKVSLVKPDPSADGLPGSGQMR